MFYTPKPRQFQYRPRLYDPKQEELEQLKVKYRLEQGLPIDDDAMIAQVKAEREAAGETMHAEQNETGNAMQSQSDDDLAYFQKKVRALDKQEREKRSKLTFSDMFRKREAPKFHYVSRFDENGNLVDTPSQATGEAPTQHRIKHRFDNDDDGFKPVPAGKIMLSCIAVLILLLFIFW